MSPDEFQKTADFILRSHADSIIRMERFETRVEHFEARMEAADKKFQAKAENLQEQLDLLAAAARDLVKAGRRHEESLRRLDKNHAILTRIANDNSRRIARLEAKGR